jgi:hypothetical protein
MAVAFVEPLMQDSTPLRLGVATFSLAAEGKGVARIADVVLEADPVDAPLPDGSFALAYTAMGSSSPRRRRSSSLRRRKSSGLRRKR